MKGNSVDLKYRSVSLLRCGHVFQNLSNCNIMMISEQGNDSGMNKILDSIRGI
jgi:hypothetical protein